jgi:hypothetical protein
MANNRNDNEFRQILQAEDLNHEARAASRLKARVYSALIREQQASGSLQNLSETEKAGHGLCIFEKLVQIAPIGETAKTPFFCWCCHARVLAETMEGAPIYWANCPYARFQKR